MYDFVARNALSKVFRVLARRLGEELPKVERVFQPVPYIWFIKLVQEITNLYFLTNLMGEWYLARLQPILLLRIKTISILEK